jgi:hypothetical protein
MAWPSRDPSWAARCCSVFVVAGVGGVAHIFCGNYGVAGEVIDELMILADDKGAMSRKAWGMASEGLPVSLGRPTDERC